MIGAPATTAQRARAGEPLIFALGAIAGAAVAIIDHFPLAIVAMACLAGEAARRSMIGSLAPLVLHGNLAPDEAR